MADEEIEPRDSHRGGEAGRHQSRHVIHFTVDGEPYETTEQRQTPDEIIQKYGGKDPAKNYLVQIEGHHKISYQGKGEEPIDIHEGARFQIISTGPTPVSDIVTKTGVGLFADGLRSLGYDPQIAEGYPNHVVINYKVPTGRYSGRDVRLGFIVSADFPLTPPSGLHVSPDIYPINTAHGPHPTFGIHRSHSAQFSKSFGGNWQYWSRPFPDWGICKKTVATYMNYVWQLWDSQ